MHQATSETLAIFLFGILAFMSGYVLFTLYDVNSINTHQYDIVANISQPVLFYLVLALCMVTLTGAYLVIQTVINELGSFDAYFDTPVRVRNLFVDYQENPLKPPPLTYKFGSYLVNIGFASTLFGGVLLVTKGWRRWGGLLVIFVFTIASFSTVGRYTLFNSLFFLFFSYLLAIFYTNEKLKKRRLIELSAFTVLLIFFVGGITYFVINIRSTLTSESAVIEYTLKTSYLYLTGGIPAFDKFLNQDFLFAHGGSSLRSVFRWLIKLGIWPEESLKTVHESFVTVTPVIQINTYTYMKSFFEDFGMSGVLIGSFIFGATCKLIHYSYLRRFTFIGLGLTLTFIFTAFMSFYSFYLHSITTIIYRLLFIWVIQVLLSKHLFKK